MLAPVVFWAIVGTTRCKNVSSISMRDLANGFWNGRRSTWLVASFPAGSRANTAMGALRS